MQLPLNTGLSNSLDYKIPDNYQQFFQMDGVWNVEGPPRPPPQPAVTTTVAPPICSQTVSFWVSFVLYNFPILHFPFKRKLPVHTHRNFIHSAKDCSPSCCIVSLINIDNWPSLRINNFQQMNQIRSRCILPRCMILQTFYCFVW